MDRINKLLVSYNGKLVGTMALFKNALAAFEYDKEWLAEIEKLFRLMCFNIFVHNRDDHSKNFTYLYDENEERWILSPAYDLTFSYSIGGEYATTVNGNGRDPSMTEILEVAKNIGMKDRKAKNIADEIRIIVKDHELI